MIKLLFRNINIQSYKGGGGYKLDKLCLDNKDKSPIVSIIATKSGTGKTTLIEGTIKILKSRGYSVGALKYDAHKFEIDKEGKDSYRFTKAGADSVIILSSEKLAMVKILKEENTIEEAIKLFGDLDIIIIEGFKKNNYPKIEVHRKGVDNNLLCKNPDYNIPTFIAVASDEELEVEIPILDLNNVASIANFIEKNFIR